MPTDTATVAGSPITVGAVLRNPHERRVTVRAIDSGRVWLQEGNEPPFPLGVETLGDADLSHWRVEGEAA